VAAFGLEIEPNIFAVFDVTLTTMNGETHTLTQPVDGVGGAKFFGWIGGSVKSIQITCAGECGGFAIAEMVKAEVAVEVPIDIKPGSFPNSINPKSNGVIPVAILTTQSFDATAIDPLSVRFGPKEAREAHGKGHIQDVNNDGEPDLVLHFRTQDTGIKCGDTSASLTGETSDGDPIQGSDSIKTVGCK
jgi:hypothetical protein